MFLNKVVEFTGFVFFKFHHFILNQKNSFPKYLLIFNKYKNKYQLLIKFSEHLVLSVKMNFHILHFKCV